jgi:hypothetical protein
MWKYLIALMLILQPVSLCLADEVVLKGSVERTIPQGTPVSLKVVSMPMQTGFYMENWDLDGKFIPPKEGDQITSELVKPVYIAGDLVLPAGTKFYGQVSRVIAPKRFGKDGRLEISFLGLQTPKGKILKFKEAPSMLTGKERSRKQNIAYGAARVGTYAAGGAAAGALVAYYAAGLFLTAANPYYVLGSGAGVGLLVGVVGAVLKKGKPGHLMPGDELKINLEQSLVLPVAEPITESRPQAFTAPGLNLKTLQKKLVKDDFDRSVLVINLEVNNATAQTIYGSDFALLGPYNKQVLPGSIAIGFERDKKSPIYGKAFLRAAPGEAVNGQLIFEIDFPGFDHVFVLKDHYSQQVIFQEPLGNPLDYVNSIGKKHNLKKRFFGEANPWN